MYVVDKGRRRDGVVRDVIDERGCMDGSICRQPTYLALVPVLGELSNTTLSSCLLVMMTVLGIWR